ncbi:MAG: CheB methylesterase domain-containing protein [Defluviitaleaceae bacterium]|nr:CheB methylesterase domain-containing protein [Defluviitaleaceae bacterium]
MVLSKDIVIKNIFEAEFAKAGWGSNARLNTIFDLVPNLRKGAVNVLIFDTETVSASPSGLKSLVDGYSVFVILVGIKTAVPYMTSGTRGAVAKPDSDNAFARRVFIRNIFDRIDTYGRVVAPAPLLDTRLAANVTDQVIVIAASTGGTEALVSLLTALPANVPPILIVQHMPGGFTTQFADRLNVICKFAVKEADKRDLVKKNQALVAPGGLHMRVKSENQKLIVECAPGEKVHGVIPAADVTFNGMAEFMGKNVIGVVLTGMGRDGSRGLYNLKKRGATIFAQDKESCVVYGMPDATVKLGVVDYQMPPEQIAAKIATMI